jgi:exodeoxyribonuclease V beta subunit
VGGSDEGDDEATQLVGASTFRGRADMPWAAVRGGKHFGVLVHSVMERVDPMHSDLSSHVRSIVDDELRRARVGVDAAVITEGIVRCLESPLGAIGDRRTLAQIPVTDRLAELSFDLPLVDTSTPVPLQRIGTTLLDTLSSSDPIRPYAEQLMAGRFPGNITGFLQGSIDALLRLPGTDGQPTFVVVDYKTNTLHRPDDAVPIEAYHPDRLVDGMVRNDYPLQALLYSVAVHRFLRRRLPEYDPSVHLGGIAYLFMRGMVGTATPTASGEPYGVFSWRPPAASIVELDSLFSRAGAR